MFTLLLNPLAILISLSTATGVLVHDMHIDAATSTILGMPAVATMYDTTNKFLGGDAHTHVERSTMAQAIVQLQGQNPRVHPRVSEDKKYLLQKYVARGHHAFDNYNLPIV